MTTGRKVSVWVAAGILIAGGIAAWIYWRTHQIKVLHLEGAVLQKNTDPRKQVPVAGVNITATSGGFSAHTVSGPAGGFRLELQRATNSTDPIMLRFERARFKPLELEDIPHGQLYLAYMTSEATAIEEQRTGPVVAISNPRIRYTAKGSSTMNVGSAAKTFEVVNAGNVACAEQTTCSPDGKWKAALSKFTMDAGESNQFQNLRLSCIAGPCPFTRVETNNTVDDGRRLAISVLNWSDTTTFLVEAEVAHTMQNDVVRHSYPAIFGRVMSFSLPASAEGPTVEAELNGTEIVFPMGPDLILTWATCSMDVADHTKLYRCELKPGYEFR